MRFLCASIMFFTCLFATKAQVIIENPDSKIKVFNADTPVDSTKTSTKTLRSVVHFGLLHPARGIFPLYYERVLTGHLGATIGAGITYADFFKSEHFDIINGTNGAKMGAGFFSDIALKYYLKGLAIEEFYLAPDFRFYTFNYSLQDQTVDQTFKTQERYYNYMLLAGTQFSDWSSVLVYDFYVGFGFSKKYVSEQELVNSTGTFEPFYIVTSDKLRPMFRLGIKMGIRIN